MQRRDTLSERTFFDKHTPKAEAEAMMQAVKREHRKPKLSQRERMLQGLDEEYRREVAELLNGLEEFAGICKSDKLVEALRNAVHKTKKATPFEFIQFAIELQPLLEGMLKSVVGLHAIKMKDPRQTTE